MPISKNLKRTEGKVEGLGREVTNDVGSVASPERKETLITVSAREAVDDALVGSGETTLLDHLILVLDQELRCTKNGPGSDFPIATRLIF